MRIRIATPADAPALASLAIAFRNHLERTEPTDAQFRDNVARLISQPDAEFFLATTDHGAPAGYVLQRYRHSMWAAGTEAAIEDLFVDPAVRKGGIGKALVRFALAGRRKRAVSPRVWTRTRTMQPPPASIPNWASAPSPSVGTGGRYFSGGGWDRQGERRWPGRSGEQ